MSHKCLVMFSGGLDSVIACHLLKSQGLEVEALHFVLPFDAGIGNDHRDIRRYARSVGVPLRIVEEGEDFLAMLRDPSFGFGKNVNPCIDCRIHRMRKAGKIMEETGAAFVATGEVVGQRPMSQRRDALNAIEKRCGLEGLLLRPLSAKLLEPTIPEKEGWVDRERLLGIRGRSRKAQLAYAREHGLEHASPAGGCTLTQDQTAMRYNDLAKHKPDFTLRDLKLIARGRHFRVSPSVLFVVGRTASENSIVQKLVEPGDTVLELADFPGPFGLMTGQGTEDDLTVCCRILVRYSKARDRSVVRVNARHGEELQTVECSPVSDQLCGKLRV